MHTNHTETEVRRARGQLAAGSVRNTKDREVPVLEVRAGMPAVGCTTWDAVGLSSTNRNRDKMARRAQWREDCDPSILREAGIWPLQL